jgi:hypothetical protein
MLDDLPLKPGFADTTPVGILLPTWMAILFAVETSGLL